MGHIMDEAEAMLEHQPFHLLSSKQKVKQEVKELKHHLMAPPCSCHTTLVRM